MTKHLSFESSSFLLPFILFFMYFSYVFIKSFVYSLCLIVFMTPGVVKEVTYQTILCHTIA